MDPRCWGLAVAGSQVMEVDKIPIGGSGLAWEHFFYISWWETLSPAFKKISLQGSDTGCSTWLSSLVRSNRRFREQPGQLLTHLWAGMGCLWGAYGVPFSLL